MRKLIFNKIQFCLFLALITVCNLYAQKDTIKIKQLLSIAATIQNQYPDSCFKISKEAYQLSIKNSYSAGQKRASMRIASVHLIKSNYDSSLSVLNELIQLAEQTNDTTSVAQAYMLKSYVYQSNGYLDSAFFHIFRSIELAEKINNGSLAIINCSALADLYLEQNEFDKALKSYNKGLMLVQKYQDYNNQIALIMGIGSVHYLKNEIRQALHYYLQCNSLAIKYKDEHARAQNLNNIALCYADLGDYKKGLFYYEQALTLYKEREMLGEEANAYYNIGQLYFNAKDYAQVLNYSEKGLLIATQIKSQLKTLDFYDLLANTNSKLGKFEKAYYYRTKFAELSKTLINEEKTKHVAEMEAKFQSNLKASKISILQKENELARVKASRNLGINFGLGGALLGVIFISLAFYLQSKKRKKLNQELSIEKQKSDSLLLNILPEEIAEELKASGHSEARLYNQVTVLFTDFVNFTGISEQMKPTELVQEIHKNFTAFDAIMEKYGIEKIKTIGDAYLAVSGLPNENPNHAKNMILAAKDIQQFMSENHGKFQIRIGIHSGAVVAGIVGVKKYAYDIWGDTVNTAARMEQNSEPGKINISDATYALVKDDFTLFHRGKINAKNKGDIDMYFVV